VKRAGLQTATCQECASTVLLGGGPPAAAVARLRSFFVAHSGHAVSVDVRDGGEVPAARARLSA